MPLYPPSSGAGGAHASDHENGGTDEIDLTGLSGSPTPGAHAASHESGGGDEIDVTGLTGAGGGGSSVPYLDSYSDPLDGTYGDDFDGSGLGAWARHNITSGMETRQVGGGSWLEVAITSATADQLYTQAISAGDFDFICSMTYWATPGTTPMYGLFAITSTGAGRGPLVYASDFNGYHGVLTGYTYASHSGAISHGVMALPGRKMWYRLTRVGTSLTAYISGDGSNWGRPQAATDAASFDRIAIGRVFGGGTTDYWLVDRFDRVV